MASRSSKTSGAARRNGRLNRLDWLEAGQAILCEKGISGLKLAALTRRLHVSTGSFYHHFPDFEAYLNAVADHYTADQVRDALRDAAEGAADPLGRLRRIRSISLSSGSAVTCGPASRRSTDRPPCVSSLAAQPPVAPEPTTTASYIRIFADQLIESD